MIDVTVRGAEAVEARLAALEGEVGVALERGLRAASFEVRGQLSRMMSARGGTDPFLGKLGAPAPELGVRSGGTRARLTPGGQVYQRGDAYVAPVGSPDRHVRFMEEGGTISGHPYLRVPLAPAQRGSGQDRYGGVSLRHVEGFFPVRSHGGKLFLATERGGKRSRRVEFWYLLVRSTRHEPRRTFKTARDLVEPLVLSLVRAPVELAVGRANG